MDEIPGRLLVAAAVGIVALLLARTARQSLQPVHPAVNLRSASLPAGVILFTSTACVNCARARAALRSADFEFREVTWELEPALLEAVGVQAVPLVVVQGNDGATLLQIVGVPRRRALRRMRRMQAAP